MKVEALTQIDREQRLKPPVKSVCIDFPLIGGKYLAQLVLPRALCKRDAERWIGLIKCWPQTDGDKLPMGVTLSGAVDGTG